jgi:hypothetical protein
MFHIRRRIGNPVKVVRRIGQPVAILAAPGVLDDQQGPQKRLS